MSKRVLVTGGCGFIGHHVIDTFLEKTDWDIVSLDRLDYSGNLNRLDYVISKYPKEDRKRVKIVWHDLKADISGITRSLIGKIDIIIHLAAASHVDRSITNPMEFVMDNTVGTVNLLEYARALPNLERFIYFNTDEIFGIAPPGVSYKERDRYNSTNPYSASKAAAGEFCVAYENTYNLPVFITNTMNVMGERQHPEKFIPKSIRKMLLGEKIFIHADSTRTIPGSRFYIHARDVADALLFLLSLSKEKLELVHTPDYGGAKCPKFNIVGKEEIDNLRLIHMIGKHLGIKPDYELVDFHSSRPGHDLRYALDGSYMKSLGWEPKLSLDERMKETVHWFRKNTEWLEA